MRLNDPDNFANIDDKLILSLYKRYIALNPLLFLRSVEKATSASDLFDILETVPSLPVKWSEIDHKWISADELLEVI